MLSNITSHVYLGERVYSHAEFAAAKTYISKNRPLLCRLFFEHANLCNWGLVQSGPYFYEIFDVKSFADDKLNQSQVQGLIKKARAQCSPPTFSEYTETIAMLGKPGPYEKIISRLSGYNTFAEMDEKQFDLSCESIHQLVHVNELSQGLKRIHFAETERAYLDVLDRETSSLYFLGKFGTISRNCSLDKAVLYYLYDKALSADPDQNPYQQYRSKGVSYAAISNVNLNNGLFVTGILSSFADVFESVCQSVDHSIPSEESFSRAKQCYKGELVYAKGQFGDVFGLIPYHFFFGRIVSPREILETIENISYATFIEFLPPPLSRALISIDA